MLFYVALIWNNTDPERAETARQLLRQFHANVPGWRTVVAQNGFSLCCPSSPDSKLGSLHVLPNAQGVVFGKLFERSYIDRNDTHTIGPDQVVLDESRSAAIIASAGHDLIDRYWGQYVAFLCDPLSRRRWVIRDPSGGVPCQWTRIQGVDVYFVRLQDCEQLGSSEFSINRHYLLGYLIYVNQSSRETGLREIETVLPGECVAHRLDERTHSFYWNPLQIAGTDAIEDATEAVRLTRNTVRTCVHAWASCFDRILLSLSGGLDSSIILSCLADAPTSPRVLCRNFYAVGPNSDERLFARSSAQSADFELIEEEVKTDFDLGMMREIPRSIFPVAWPYDLKSVQEDVQFLNAHGLSASFNGHGGDELFFRGGAFPTAVDYTWRHGIRPAVISVALDDAALNQASLWAILRVVARYGVWKQPWHLRQSVSANHRPLMVSALKEEARRDLELWHPLYRELPDLPPGKWEHAYLLTSNATAFHYPTRPPGAPDYVSPLISQPMMELSLRTPLYLLRTGGRDRAIARRAFAADVPPEIISRKSKVFGDAQLEAVLFRNIDFVRELLLDGLLVREGFLDRGKLEEALSCQVSRIQSGIMELCEYLSVEMWMRSWTQSQRRAAA